MIAYTAQIAALRSRMLGIDGATLRARQRALIDGTETTAANLEAVAIGCELLARDLARLDGRRAEVPAEVQRDREFARLVAGARP